MSQFQKTRILLFLPILLMVSLPLYGQFTQAPQNEALIRIAEPGQLADTLNLWGDVGQAGRYLVPRGTTVHELISYGGGPGELRGGGNLNPWTKVSLQVNISHFNENSAKESIKSFSFKYSDPIPPEMRNYRLSNEEIVSIEVKRKPAFIDYLGVIGPILSAITTSYVIYDQIIRQ